MCGNRSSSFPRWNGNFNIYTSHDQEHNNAVALKEFLQERLRSKTSHSKIAEA